MCVDNVCLACLCVCVCVCVCVHALRIVSRDKILSFKNTLLLLLIIMIMCVVGRRRVGGINGNSSVNGMKNKICVKAAGTFPSQLLTKNDNSIKTRRSKRYASVYQIV